MPHVSTSRRLILAALALLAEGLHLGWEAWHGGIDSHHLLQSAAMPAISNAWGLLVLPALAAWAAGRLPRPGDTARSWRPIALGFALPLLLGAALSLAFGLKLQALTETIFFALLLVALLLPAHRPESLLGFVLGMSWTFGAVLPTLIGAVIAALSWALRGAARRAWRAVRPA
ncbi:MAG: hypothetical protein ACT6RP_18670 [Roseateles sp.]|uniref:hypothetical protein n=1 Tax=Roseateles sp. TaxID=1971397 RepID=UPI0040352F22